MGAPRLHVLGIVIAVLLVVSQRGHAQTTAAGPYYATPSWDQTFPCVPGNCPRFVVLSNMNNEAVLDRETGLVWQRTVGGVFGKDPSAFMGAVQLCSESPTGGRGGWRLPSLHEFQSLVDETVPLPALALPAGHPFLGVPDAFTTYWTGTSVVGFETRAYSTTLQAVTGPASSDKTESKRFWCVRSAGPLSTY